MSRATSERTSADFESSPDHVQSLARGLEVIRAFSAENPALSLSAVAERVGLSRAAARRFLLTLEHLGYVRSDERLFRLTPRVLELGYAYLSSLDVSDLLLPLMEGMAKQLDESSSLAVLQGDEIVYVLRVPVRKVMTMNIAVGAHLPAHATSMGRVLLAGLPEEELAARLKKRRLPALTPHTLTDTSALRAELQRVAAQGWALVQQEMELGLCSLAVPVRHRGRVAAALNVGMRWHERCAEDARERVLPALKRTAAAIEDAIRPLQVFG
ncbi:MAG: helix-turn-helix domain-containing protein [Myxococcaceae bacterium]|nr:helix-turn-helix domain-containing protein [Myxococcaceae bacterium]